MQHMLARYSDQNRKNNFNNKKICVHKKWEFKKLNHQITNNQQKRTKKCHSFGVTNRYVWECVMFKSGSTYRSKNVVDDLTHYIMNMNIGGVNILSSLIDEMAVWCWFIDSRATMHVYESDSKFQTYGPIQ